LSKSLVAATTSRPRGTEAMKSVGGIHGVLLLLLKLLPLLLLFRLLLL
jgi:hypothetical protein